MDNEEFKRLVYEKLGVAMDETTAPRKRGDAADWLLEKYHNFDELIVEADGKGWHREADCLRRMKESTARLLLATGRL